MNKIEKIEVNTNHGPEGGRKRYHPPKLEVYGLVTEVTQKSGGAEDGGAAMMDKSGQG